MSELKYYSNGKQISREEFFSTGDGGKDTGYFIIIMMMIVFFILVIAGCPDDQILPDPNTPPLDSHILSEPNDWKTAYGDGEKSKIYFNLAVMRNVINNQGKVITQLIKDVNDLKTVTIWPDKSLDSIDELWEKYNN